MIVNDIHFFLLLSCVIVLNGENEEFFFIKKE